MRLSVRFYLVFAGLGVLALGILPRAQAQAQSQSQSQTQSTSSQTPIPSQPTYVVLDPLANVRYDNRYDLSLSMAYAHIKAGPNLQQGANLGDRLSGD